MTVNAALAGIWAAVLTPVDAQLRPDAPRAIAYYRDLLDQGCDGINLLGTTGEAMSFGTDARLRFMEAIARSGLPLERFMVGTGAAALDDTARLMRGAAEFGFRAALVMPPFFFRDAGDDGIVAFFDALFARTNAPPRSVMLYNFPRMSGVTFHAGLIDRLRETFPQRIAGVKDSSNDRGLQAQILARHPDLAIFPSSEEYLRAEGTAGCISGSVALWLRDANRVLHGTGEEQAAALAARRRSIAALPLIAAVRHLTAKARADDAWERAMPPQAPLTPSQRSALDALALV